MKASEHLLPFLWLRGEDEETLRQGVRDVAASGCGSVCIESRIHPDFLGDGWWRDVDIVNDECKRLGITYYILDDTQFPSGYANGKAKGTPYCRMMVTEAHMDVRGPQNGGCLMVRSDEDKGMPVAVVAGRKLETGTLERAFVDIGGFAVTDLTDLTDRVQDGLIRWNVPEGTWRVFVLTANYVSERSPARWFANPLLPEGGRLMIDTVYEAHYAHIGSEFGRTFRGFFSDEPALRAGRGSHAVLGEYPLLPVPWRMDLPRILSEELGRDARVLLPGLWYDIGPDTEKIRYVFMDTVSRLYGENYSSQIGRWCQAHGVEYIGHVIEQGDAHSRLGQGAGHFFRAQSGQTISGMDYVLHELRPEFHDGFHAWKSQDFEAEDDFFRYMLPQMTVSAAALDPKKHGRALCEIFGAYGWQEDVGEMRYLANFLLSRGINYYVPHAFSMQPFPDPDSPPHFGAFNPLMPAVSDLFRAMGRACDILDGGKHIARVGVLYYAEAEWACGSSVMKTQAVVRELNRRQIECEIVPIELLEPGRYDALIVPEAAKWPEALYEKLIALKNSGCAVAFVGSVPQSPAGRTEVYTEAVRGVGSIALNSCAAWALAHSRQPAVSVSDSPCVHVYPYEKDGRILYAVFNELYDAPNSIELKADRLAAPVLYDPERNESYIPESKNDALRIALEPAQLLILADPLPDRPAARPMEAFEPLQSVSPVWHITFPGTDIPAVDTAEPEPLADYSPRFSGTARYETEITLDKDCTGLEFEDMNGSVSLYADGKLIASRSAKPYRFTGIEPGKHTLALEVTVPLVFRHRDPLSFFAYVKPYGVYGPVTPLRKAH